jgi:hypothetical protein
VETWVVVRERGNVKLTGQMGEVVLRRAIGRGGVEVALRYIKKDFLCERESTPTR